MDTAEAPDRTEATAPPAQGPTVSQTAAALKAAARPASAVTSAAQRARRPRQVTKERRQDIVKAAAEVFGARGYKGGSLVEVAEKVGMTHAGVLHHFGSKDNLLLEVLEYRDTSGVEGLEGGRLPGGRALFEHLSQTTRDNEERPGLVQSYAVLSAESVTDDHPAQEYFRQRFAVLRGQVADALAEVCPADDQPTRDETTMAAAGIIGAMDGLQVQWLLDPDSVHLAEASAFAIDAILAAVIARH